MPFGCPEKPNAARMHTRSFCGVLCWSVFLVGREAATVLVGAPREGVAFGRDHVLCTVRPCGGHGFTVFGHRRLQCAQTQTQKCSGTLHCGQHIQNLSTRLMRAQSSADSKNKPPAPGLHTPRSTAPFVVTRSVRFAILLALKSTTRNRLMWSTRAAGHCAG